MAGRYAVLDELHHGERVAAIHTSDRGLYKSCRRRWHWQSHLRSGLEPFTKASPLWFGSGIHFALESVHGSQYYPSGRAAFEDYVRASIEDAKDRLPPDWQDLLQLGRGMMDYYENEWLTGRDALPTYVKDGVPQIEVQFEVELPCPPELLGRAEIDKLVYRGTIDRVAIDPVLGGLYIVEYKTAAQFEILHLNTDPQINAYMWAMKYIYDLPCLGVIYQQHLKAVPEEARLLASGKISYDKRQNTSHRRYQRALVDMYGKEYYKVAPPANIQCLNELCLMEDDMKDPYIRRDKATRSDRQIESEGVKVLIEAYEMINPDTPLYPYATRTCKWCPFESPCLALDDGDDFEDILNDPDLYVKRTSESTAWQLSTARQPKPLNLRAVILQEQLQNQLELLYSPVTPELQGSSLSPVELLPNP